MGGQVFGGAVHAGEQKQAGGGEQESFDINSYKKENMLNGYDDIDYLTKMKSEIQEFAEARPF